MTAFLLGAVLIGVFVFLALFVHFIPIGLWISAYFAGVRVALFRDLVSMRLSVSPRMCRE